MPRVKQFDEKEVLQKAMNLFWEKGYYATSIQDLVDHLGINRASLYDTFGGKKELFNQAFSHYRNTNIQAVRQFLTKQESIRQGLKSLFEMALLESQSDSENKGCFVVNTTVEFLPNEKDALQILMDNKVEVEKIFYDFLSLGVKRGEISTGKNLEAIATLLFTFYNGLKVVTKIDADTTHFRATIDSLLTILD